MVWAICLISLMVGESAWRGAFGSTLTYVVMPGGICSGCVAESIPKESLATETPHSGSY